MLVEAGLPDKFGLAVEANTTRETMDRDAVTRQSHEPRSCTRCCRTDADAM